MRLCSASLDRLQRTPRICKRWSVFPYGLNMPLQPGTSLGPYQIDAPLGAGGMGEVYKARDTRLDRTVAIKVLPEHVADDPDLRQRFEREAKTISSLNHPRICTLHDIGSQDGVDFLVMEYLDGETLAQRFLERGTTCTRTRTDRGGC